MLKVLQGRGSPCCVDLRGPGFQKPPLQTNFCSGPCKQNTGKNGPSGVAFIEPQGYLKVWCWLTLTQAAGEPLC